MYKRFILDQANKQIQKYHQRQQREIEAETPENQSLSSEDVEKAADEAKKTVASKTNFDVNKVSDVKIKIPLQTKIMLVAILAAVAIPMFITTFIVLLSEDEVITERILCGIPIIWKVTLQ